jgi:hypothetical protein
VKLPRLLRRRGAATPVVAGCHTCGRTIGWGPRSGRAVAAFLAEHRAPCRTWIDLSANEFRLPEP